MSQSNAANQQSQKLHDDVQSAVKTILGATQALSPADYSKVLTSTLAVTAKSVKIQIAPDDLRSLRQSGYKLCFAKKVSGADYDVVWQTYQNFLTNNSFSWSPQYQLFGTNVFQDNLPVEISTNLVNIGPGQQSTMDQDGILSEAISGSTPNAITLINTYGPIYPGITQLSTGIDGRQISTPVYVSANKMVGGRYDVTPSDTLLVWFEQEAQTGSVFTSSRSNSIEVDLSFNNLATRRYEGGVWKVV